MNEKEQLKKLKQEYFNMDVPKEGLVRMRESIDKAKMAKRRTQRNRRIRNAGVGVAAALVIAVALPNMNANIAYAMEKLPVIGGFFKVVTFRDYEYDDANNNAEVKVPQVSVEAPESGAVDEKLQDSAAKINLDIEKLTQDLIKKFEDTVAASGGEGHMGLYVNHEVVTDNDRWFTLKLTMEETQASGFTQEKYYTVDKQTGEVVGLSGLFRQDSDYVTVLSANIKEQMRARMKADEEKVYYLDSDMPIDEFEQISGDQNFYFNKDGGLTIVFDEYEVAPGYMGVQEFVIPSDVTAGIVK